MPSWRIIYGVQGRLVVKQYGIPTALPGIAGCVNPTSTSFDESGQGEIAHLGLPGVCVQRTLITKWVEPSGGQPPYCQGQLPDLTAQRREWKTRCHSTVLIAFSAAKKWTTIIKLLMSSSSVAMPISAMKQNKQTNDSRQK